MAVANLPKELSNAIDELYRDVINIKTDDDTEQFITNILASNPKWGGMFAIMAYKFIITEKNDVFAVAASSAIYNYYMTKRTREAKMTSIVDLNTEHERLLKTLTTIKTDRKTIIKITLEALMTTPEISLIPLLTLYYGAFKEGSTAMLSGIHWAFDNYHDHVNKK